MKYVAAQIQKSEKAIKKSVAIFTLYAVKRESLNNNKLNIIKKRLNESCKEKSH